MTQRAQSRRRTAAGDSWTWLSDEDNKLLDEAWEEVAKKMRDGKYKDYFERMPKLMKSIEEEDKKDKGKSKKKDKADKKKDKGKSKKDKADKKKAAIRRQLLRLALEQPRGSEERKATLRFLSQ